jgi:hypothetical protein
MCICVCCLVSYDTKTCCSYDMQVFRTRKPVKTMQHRAAIVSMTADIVLLLLQYHIRDPGDNACAAHFCS